MRPDEYAAMYAVEDEHWWYVGMRRVADALLRDRFNGARDRGYRGRSPRSEGRRARSRRARRGEPCGEGQLGFPNSEDRLNILDAGCGTGGNSAHLRAYGRVTGVDFSADALRFAAERPGLRLARASVEALPFADASFDLVLSNDVLCHLGVASDAVAVREFARVLRPGGVLFLQLPAYEWLRSHHDAAVHTGHRYTAAEMRALLRAGGLQPRRVTYANAALLPVAAAWRVLHRLLPDRAEDARSDVRPVAGPLNAVMRAVLGLESRLLARRNLPWGLSVIGVAENTAGRARSDRASTRETVAARSSPAPPSAVR